MSSDLCEPGVENCAAQPGQDEFLQERPDGGAFGSLIGIYFGQIIAPVISFLLAYIIQPGDHHDFGL